MNMLAKFALATAFTSLSATAVLASDPIAPGDDGFTEYSTVGDWTVYVDVERQSCLIEAVDSNMNVVQMGLTKNHKHGYIGVFTLADIDIKNKQKVFVDIDGVVFEGKAKGLKTKKLKGDYSGGYLVVKDGNLVTAIAEGQTMIVFPKKTAAFVVDLTGTKKAMEEGRKCNLAQVS